MKNKPNWQRKGFNPMEKRILTVLYRAEKPMSTYGIAKHSEMSWQIAKNHLLELHDRKYLNRGKYGKSIYWWLKTNK